MAARGRLPLTDEPPAASLRPRGDARERPDPQRASPLVYTAQDVAHFCEVDLKTIHHWANANKIAHHRTEGRHIRIRRNDLVRFLRAHGYPLHDAITSVRPTVFVASGGLEELASDDVAKKLATRFFVRRFAHAAAAIARLVHDQPDAIVCSSNDPSWNPAATVAALKADPETASSAIVVIAARGAGDFSEVDLVVPIADVSRLVATLSKHLAVSG